MDIVSKEIEMAYNKIIADDATLEFFWVLVFACNCFFMKS